MDTHTAADADTQRTPTRATAYKLRLPSDLFERLRRLAQAHDRSLNGELVWALRAYVANVEREEAAENREVSA